MQTVYLDTETTGLNPERGDTMVEIGIVDDAGDVLISTLVNPGKTISPEASRVNGITDDMVINAPSRDEVMPQVIDAVKGKTVVIYNAGFDTRFLPEIEEVSAEIRCCMLAYAEYKGEWNDYYENYRWHKLISAAQHVCFEWGGDKHRAANDALACRAVWRFLNDPSERKRVKSLWQDEMDTQKANNYLFKLKYDREREEQRFAKKAWEMWKKALNIKTFDDIYPTSHDRNDDLHWAFLGMSVKTHLEVCPLGLKDGFPSRKKALKKHPHLVSEYKLKKILSDQNVSPLTLNGIKKAKVWFTEAGKVRKLYDPKDYDISTLPSQKITWYTKGQAKKYYKNIDLRNLSQIPKRKRKDWMGFTRYSSSYGSIIPH